jgi:WD40 repeat protein
VAGAHKRIVWTCGWTVDGQCLATGSRDGVCKLWSVGPATADGAVAIQCVHSFSPFAGVSVTALDFGPCVPATGPGMLWAADPGDLPVGSGAPSQSQSHSHSHSHSHLLALGSEAGDISYWELVCAGQDAVAVRGAQVATVSPAHCHGATVKRISWAPDAKVVGATRAGVWKVASGGEDHCVRVFALSCL